MATSIGQNVQPFTMYYHINLKCLDIISTPSNASTYNALFDVEVLDKELVKNGVNCLNKF